ncbi:unnamed protein product [Polarella glacialis]|uniref:C2H2-type domain-containing protein n=1 Tax=Polarella glacialis TaxID=89957 RepID=A0A813D143_POLGL|nr:unnamed protein product [Polarella glacialis]
MPLPCTDDSIAWLFDRLSIAPAAVHRLRARLEQASCLERCGVSPHLQAMTARCHEDTFFTTKGVKAIGATASGTRPGDPFGDALFSFLMTECLQGVRDRLKEGGLAYEAPWSGRRVVGGSRGSTICQLDADPAYYDDFVQLVEPETAQGAVSKVQAVMEILDKEMQARGLRLNYKPGKTGVLLHLVGVGAKEVRRQVFIEQSMQVPFETIAGETAKVHVVHAYRHVGSVATANASNKSELACRRACGAGALRPLRTAVYGNSRFSVEARKQLMESLVHSRLLHNVHIWCNFTGTDYAGMHRATMLGLRAIHDKYAVEQEDYRNSDAKVLARLGHIEPRHLISIARLRYLPRMLKQGPDCLFAFLEHTAGEATSWAEQLRLDTAWLRGALCTIDVPDFESKPEDFFGYVEENPGRWKGLVKAAARKHIERNKEQERVSRLEQEFVQFAVKHGAVQEQMFVQASVADQFICYDCEQTFGTVQGLGVHMHRMHGRRQMCRWFAQQDSCGSCLKKFHSRARLVVHLSQSSPRCLEHLMRVNQPLEDAEVAELDHEDKLRNREEKKKGIGPRQALLPAFDLQGPKLPQAPWPERLRGRHGGQQEEEVCDPAPVVRTLGTASRPDDSPSEPWSDQSAPAQLGIPPPPSVRTLGTVSRPDDALSEPWSDRGAPATEVEHQECVGVFKGLNACFQLGIQTVRKKGTALSVFSFVSVAGLLKCTSSKNQDNKPGSHKCASTRILPPEICKVLGTEFARHLKGVESKGGLRWGGELRVDLQIFHRSCDLQTVAALTEVPATDVLLIV